jgi:hypothetical protein
LAGGSARPRGGGGGAHRSQISLPSCPKYTKTAKKKDGFTHVLAYKSPKTLFFAQKYFTRYTQTTFFEECINFKSLAELYLFKVLEVIYAPSHPD